MKFSGKMCHMIILKVTKMSGLYLLCRNAGLKKKHSGGEGSK